MESVEAVENTLNYSFKDKNLLKEAITQTSCSNIESSTLFERLEFLGDSVLELAFTNYLHLTYPDLNFKPKELRVIRTASVSNETFARVAVKHNLHQCLILEDPDPSTDAKIKEFSEAVSKEDEPLPFGGAVKAPKILADCIESLAGAVYIDVDFDLHRVWEIFRGLVEPIYTLDRLKQDPEPERTLLRLFHVADKLGKPIEFKSFKDDEDGRYVFEVYVGDKLFGCRRSNSINNAKQTAAKEALSRMVSMPIEKIVDEDKLAVEIEDAKRKLFEICSTEKVRLQTGGSPSLLTTSENETVMDEDRIHVGLEDVKMKLFEICAAEKLRSQSESSSLPTASENSFTYEVTPTKMDVGPEDVKGESFEFCSTEMLRSRTELSSLPTASENLLTDEMRREQMVIDDKSPHEDVKRKLFEISSPEKLQLQTEPPSIPTASENPLEQMVIDDDTPNVEPVDAKAKLFEICSTRKLQIQIGSNTSVNPLTYEMPIKQMVVDEVKPKDSKLKLSQICAMNNWPNPIFSSEEKHGRKNKHRFVCSAKIEIPTIEGTFEMKGDIESKKKEAENSSAYYMIKALESSLMSNPQMRESLYSVGAVEKILNYSFKNKNLLREALTYNNSNSLLLQRLNFVGKPALSLALMNHIYLAHPKLEPNELELLRSANTRNDRFARVIVKHGIYKFLIYSVPNSEREVIKFIELLGKEDDPDPYKFVKSPKLITDLVDSIAGAVYIDVNLDVKRLWEIMGSLLEPVLTLDDLRQQPDIILTLFGVGYKQGKRVEFKYRKIGSRSIIGEVYLDDKFIACGKPNKCGNIAKMNAARAALQTLSESMPIEMVMNDYIEYEDAKEKLIGICKDRNLSNPVFSFKSFEKGYICTVKVETSTEEEGTLCIKGFKRQRKKIAENNAASHMIRTLKSSPLSRVLKNLQLQQLLDEKKDRKMLRTLEKKKNSEKRKRQSLDESKNPQTQNNLDEKKNLEMENSLDEKKSPQLHNSLDENKNQQMQNSSDEKGNLQMPNSLEKKKNQLSRKRRRQEENKNLEMENSLDENENMHQKQKKRKRR
ncbi:PREDICTED: ribonuclease 3-like protein 3 [Camelina sativa]|uniref:Ribonuclease 3-like protein 3 n=1 Tax=Camelina sativa TaxID=90675 RepID=A0ABM0W8Q8_CAMSA|nr:PREDICTED: ribonuclease 3-like protein 3 [Camelina sativa]